MDTTRSQYIASAKGRALKLLDEGDLVSSLASIGTDLTQKGPMLFPPGYIADRVGVGLQLVLDKDADALRQLIEDFA
jgi:hypothetical protein